MSYKFPLKKIKEFETNAIKSIIRKSKVKQFNVVYSQDLINSTHLKKIICQANCEKKQYPQNSIIYISRHILYGLYVSIYYATLKKSFEFRGSAIEESYEKEMVEGIKSVFFPMSLNVDNRNTWGFPLLLKTQKDMFYHKDNKKFNLVLEIPEKSNYWNRCEECKIEYPLDYQSSKCRKCGNKLSLKKEQPSSTYKKNKSNEIKYNEPIFNEYFFKFLNFMHILNRDYLSNIELKNEFQEFFDNTSKDVLFF